MDDDLLADDGQFKDDGSDDLDIDEEAALLGSSDDEAKEDNNQNDDQVLEYVDEDGNPVDIGENNADLYELADLPSRQTPSFRPSVSLIDDDILEVNVDAELENFSQEDADTSLVREPHRIPTRNSEVKELRYKENLLPVTIIPETEQLVRKTREPAYIPSIEGTTAETIVTSAPDTNTDKVFAQALELDEESEDENVDDDHRERFKSERSNIITLTPMTKRADIPDTLESVISMEETAKIQAFLANENERKSRWKSKRPVRGRSTGQLGRPPTNVFPIAPSGGSSEQQKIPVQQIVPRKILINPHFKGVRPSTALATEGGVHQFQGQIHPIVAHTSVHPNFSSPGYGISDMRLPAPQVTQQAAAFSEPPRSAVQYNQPPPHFTHHNVADPISQMPPNNFTNMPPPLSHQFNEFLPQMGNSLPPFPHMANQGSPEMWQMPPPNMVPVQPFCNPPPGPNYGEPSPAVANYTSNHPSSNFPNSSYQNSASIPVQFRPDQPPPLQHSQAPPAPFRPSHPHVITQNFSQVRQQRPKNVQQTKFQAPEKFPYRQRQYHFNQEPMKKYTQPAHYRQPEKRVANTTLRTLPMKQPRLDFSQKKANLPHIRMQNSNIKEIPLIDNFPPVQKPQENISQPIIEDEDEETRELRKKIEEQKLLREQILKRKEERRRLMASQRMLELKNRMNEQQNPKKSNPQSVQNNVVIKSFPGVLGNNAASKLNIKDRVGVVRPVQQQQQPGDTKKKIVVVRKKIQESPIPQIGNQNVPEKKKAMSILQRLGTRPLQGQKLPVRNNPIVTKNAPVSKQLMTQVAKKPKFQNKPGSKPAVGIKKPQIGLQTPQNPIGQNTKNVVKIASSPQTGQSVKNFSKAKTTITATQAPSKMKTVQTPAKPALPKQPIQGPSKSPKPSPGSFRRSPRFQAVKNQGFRMPLRNAPPDSNAAMRTGPWFSHPRHSIDRFPVPRFQNPRMEHGPIIERMPFPPPYQGLRPPHFQFQGERMPPRPDVYHLNNPPNQHSFQFRMPNPPPNFRPRGFPMHRGRMAPPRFPHQPQFPNMQEPMSEFEFFQQRAWGLEFQGKRMPFGKTLDFNRRGFPSNKAKTFVKGNPSPVISHPSSTIKVENDSQSLSAKEQPNNDTSYTSPLATKVIVKQEVQPLQKTPSPDRNLKISCEQNVTSNKTKSVVVQNLSSSTSETQLKKLCAVIGPIENFQLLKTDRKAIIKFKDGIHASQFQNKYQRHMLDLAMIEVSLLPS